MGNPFDKMSSSRVAISSSHEEPKKNLEPVETFKFHPSFVENSNNGLYFNDFYIPEEVVMMILSYIEPKEILKATLVCKKWCNLIKSNPFWGEIYSREYKKKPKKLPWYVYYCLFKTGYFNKNLIKNGNGQNRLEHWKILQNGGEGFVIEDPPSGADPLPLDIPEFNGKTSCFATSYGECSKLQEISLENCPLLQLILNEFKPHIYLSEWVAGRFDCGCVYSLSCKLYGKKSEESYSSHMLEQGNPILDRTIYDDDDAPDIMFIDSDTEPELEDHYIHVQKTGTSVEQWAGKTWSKIELVVKDYPSGVKSIVFLHEGRDTQFWAGHYGSKMAGGVLKILFDSVEPST